MISRVLSSIDQALQLLRTQGISDGFRIALQLTRKQGAIRFVDSGRSYWMPRDSATFHHLTHSVGSLRKLARFVDPADARIIDVGAHSGLFSAFAAERARGATITLIEANPRLSQVIERNLRHHTDWELIQVAISDRSGQAPFYRNETSTQTSTLVMSAVEGFGTVSEDSVQTRSLDDLFADDLPIDVMKVDVQGAEHMVIRGGARTLSRVRTLLIEASLLDPNVGRMLTYLEEEFGPPIRVNPVYAGADLAYVRGKAALSTLGRPSVDEC